MIAHKLFKSIFLISLSLITILIILWWNLITGFDISDYGNSQEGIRAALIKEVPLGSSVDDVYDFMDKNKIANITNSDGVCGYTELGKKYVSLIACIGLLDGQWLIHFSFDESKLLKDVIIVGYYP
jgi:hypothetical protein